VAEREAGAGSGRTRVAAITTSSVEALKAYIEGERAFRTGSYLPAVDAFQRAVAADPEFALAYYRLSMTEERLAWAGASQRSAEARELSARFVELWGSADPELRSAVMSKYGQ
jgi:hypothetical protein